MRLTTPLTTQCLGQIDNCSNKKNFLSKRTQKNISILKIILKNLKKVPTLTMIYDWNFNIDSTLKIGQCFNVKSSMLNINKSFIITVEICNFKLGSSLKNDQTLDKRRIQVYQRCNHFARFKQRCVPTWYTCITWIQFELFITQHFFNIVWRRLNSV